MDTPFGSCISRTVVDVIDYGGHVPIPKQFVGMYDDLPEQCWFKDSKRVAFSTCNGFYRHMYILCIDTAANNQADVLLYVKPPRHLHHQNAPLGVPLGGCWTIKSVCDDKIVVSYSSCEIMHEILIGMLTDRINANDNSIELNWVVVLQGETYLPNILLSGSVMTRHVPAFEHAVFEETLLIAPYRTSRQAPTVVMLHGGPNTAFQDEFSLINAFSYTFAACGFNVLQVNYLGSTGYGQSTMNRLTGHLMDVDVDSCIRLIEGACNEHSLNNKRLCLFGGSHSGAIGLHIMAKKPSFFCSAALRNPVCDYVSMLLGSDIPDYIFNQLFAEDYRCNFELNDELVSKLMERNPMKLVDKLYTPLLLILGSQDMRVPYMASLRLKQMLESRDVACNARIYPEGHAIKSYKYLQDSFTHTYDWYVSFINTNYYAMSESE